MSVRRLPSIANLPHRLREQCEQLPSQFRDMRRAWTDDPARLLYNPVARLMLWIALGIVAVFLLQWFIGSLAAEYAGDQLPATPTATVFVICTHEGCQNPTYHVELERDFDAWPLTCEYCGHDSVYRATRCRAIRGWVPVIPGQAVECPPKSNEPEPVTEVDDAQQTTSDDEEDGW